MEQNSKKFKKSLPFDNDLFEQADIDIINEKIERNIPGLLANDKYMDIDDKRISLNSQLNSLLNIDEQKILKKYIAVSAEAISYQNCLAYYLGLQAGISFFNNFN